jgi:hypothetical protein
VSWNGARWRLEATPRAKYPWVFYDDIGVRLAVGPPELAEARARCEFWLDVEDIYRGGLAMGNKHTGEDDSQTDHVGQGSDGHTTESGQDR